MQYVFYIGIVILAYLAFSLIYDAFILKEVVNYKPSVKRFTNKLIETISESQESQVFFKYGINLTMKKYTSLRNAVIVGVLVLTLLSVFLGSNNSALKILVVGVILYLVAKPVEFTKKGRKTIFKRALDFIAAKHLEKKDEELITVISQMKNLILSMDANTISTDYLFSRLMSYTHYSRHHFVQFLAHIRRGDRERAMRVFTEDFGTSLGVDFGRIVIKLDFLPANEFIDQIDNLQETIKDKKRTIKDRKIQTKKYIIFLLGSGQIGLIIFNYIYIVLFDTMSMMKF